MAAHELSHVIGNHIKSKTVRQTIDAIAAVLSSLSKEQDVNQMVNEVFQLTSLRYARDDEKEADVMGKFGCQTPF